LNFTKRHPRWSIVIALLLITVIAVRVLIPGILLRKLNQDLAQISPIYRLHIQDLDLSFIRMFYRFENLEGHLVKDGKPFLKVSHIDVSVAWSEIFRGRILTNVEVNQAQVIASPKLFEESQQPQANPQKDAQTAAETLFPVRVSGIQLRNSEVQFGEYLGEPDSPTWRIRELNGSVGNLTPQEHTPFTFFNLRGALPPEAPFKITGKLKRLETPMAWQVELEVQKFNLNKANPLIFRSFPLTFKAGHLDLYAGAKSQDGKMRGYAKPFFKEMQVVGNANDFKTLKHFAVEVVAAIGNAVLRRSKDKSVATRVEFFTENGQIKVDTDKALSRAIEHGFGNPLTESLEDSVNLN